MITATTPDHGALQRVDELAPVRALRDPARGELRADRGAFFGSIYATLNHIAYADLAFLARFTGEPKVVPELGADLFGGFAALRAERERIDQRLLDWTATLDAGVAGRGPQLRQQGRWRDPHAGALAAGGASSSTIRRTTAARSRRLLAQQGLDIGSTDLPFMPRSHAASRRSQ